MLNDYKNLLLMKRAYTKGGWAMQNKDLPILLLAGKEDPITLGVDSWHHSQDFLRERGYTGVFGILYLGLHHEFLRKKEFQKVFDDMLDFVNKICPVPIQQ